MSESKNNSYPQDVNSDNAESNISLNSIDPTNNIDKHFLNAGVFTVNDYDDDIADDQSVIVVSDGLNASDNNPHNAQYLFSNKGIRSRGYAMSEGATKDWTKLGVRSATVVVGAQSAGYGQPDVDFLCDGTADDVEIQAAIDSLPTEGGTVLLLEGDYKLRNRITNAKPGVVLRGSGKSTRLFYQAGGTQTGSMIQFTEDATYGTVCDLSIDAQLTGATTGGVSLRGARSTVRGVSVFNCRNANSSKTSNGIYVEGEDGLVENCFVYGANSTGSFTGIFATGEGACVQNNIVENNTASKDCTGILTSDTKTSIINNFCTGNKSTSTGNGYEIYADNYYTRVIGNTVSNTESTRPHWGIYVQCDGCVVSANYVSGLYSDTAAVTGIEIHGNSNAVTSNVCLTNSGASSAQNAGIKIYGSQNMVSGNNCQCIGGNYSILLDSSAQSNMVIANTCEGRKPVDQHTSTTNANILAYNSDSPAGGGIANVDVPDAGYVQIGKDAVANLVPNSIAIGKDANSVNIAIGDNANSAGGISIGKNSSSVTDGIGIGEGAFGNAGVVVGKSAYTYEGVAIGVNSKSDGVAIGSNAKTISSSETPIDAIQLGTGTNTAEETLQVYNYQLMDANGKVPTDRLPVGNIVSVVPLTVEENNGQWVETTGLDNLPNGVSVVHYNDGPMQGGYLVLTSVDPNTGSPQGYYGYQIKMTIDGVFSRQCSMEIVGTEASRKWSAWTPVSIPEAPNNGKAYVRKNGEWIDLSTLV